VDRPADAIPYRTDLHRDRLIYLTHPDASVGKSLGDAFMAQGVQVSMVPDLSGLMRLLMLRRPDVVVMPLCDDAGAVGETLGALDAIRGQHLGIHAFLLAPEGVRAQMVVEAMKHGASAAFSPPYEAVEITSAMLELFRGDISVEPGKDGAEAVTVRGFGTLTYRERQILHYVVEGRTNKEIAADLGLSYRTVEVHRRHVLAKIGARNTAELVRLAVES